MPTFCPPATPALSPRPAATRLTFPTAPGAWRYACVRRRSRTLVFAAALFSAAIHGGILFGFRAAKKAPPRAAAPTIQLTISMPQLKELDEPDPVPRDDDGAKPDLGQPVPMQADVPAPISPQDFVQQLDFASLVEQPDLKNLNLLTLPEHITRPGKFMEGIKIFDLASLDRIPEAVVQTPPIYPVGLRREALNATVTILFHVETDGHVSNVRVLQSDNSAFDEAAMVGVAKWRFRAGIKDGRKVVTRMTVPIVFSVAALP